MKRRNGQQNNALRTALAFGLALALVLSCTCLGWAVDLSRACSVTVSLGSGELAEELREAELVVELYRVAGAMARADEDAFDFEALAPFTALDLSAPQTQEDWNALAYQAANIARTDGEPVVENAPAETAITDLSPGLYLLLVHGRDVDEITESGETVAYAGAYRYLFAPQLLVLPTKTAAEDGSVNTAYPGEWIYDATVFLKPEREQAYDSLQILKTLTGCNENNPAVFVFSIEATLNGETVYSDVVMVEFTGAGTQEVRIEQIPIGATVTVTECYSGAGYQLASAGTQTVTITADAPNTVQFTNDYVGSPNGLRGIDNHFVFEEDSGWACTQTPAPSE